MRSSVVLNTLRDQFSTSQIYSRKQKIHGKSWNTFCYFEADVFVGSFCISSHEEFFSWKTGHLSLLKDKCWAISVNLCKLYSKFESLCFNLNERKQVFRRLNHIIQCIKFWLMKCWTFDQRSQFSERFTEW